MKKLLISLFATALLMGAFSGAALAVEHQILDQLEPDIFKVVWDVDEDTTTRTLHQDDQNKWERVRTPDLGW